MLQKVLFLLSLCWICKSGQGCTSVEKQCNDGSCVNSLVNCAEDCPKSGYRDCPGGTCISENYDCIDPGCTPKQPLKCKNEAKCYTKAQDCDGSEQCSDGSDELDCDSKTCSQGWNYNKCEDGSCVFYQMYCPEKCKTMDGPMYCPAGGCVYDWDTCIDTGCNARKPHKCRTTDECYAEYAKCNEELDCSDGSDEMDCDANGSGSFVVNIAVVVMGLIIAPLVVV